MLPMYGTLLGLIAQAMKVKAPKMYRRLKANGDLQAEISRRATEAGESYLTALEIMPKAEVMRVQNLPPLEQVAERTAARRVAAEAALADAIDFPTESEPDAEL